MKPSLSHPIELTGAIDLLHHEPGLDVQGIYDRWWSPRPAVSVPPLEDLPESTDLDVTYMTPQLLNVLEWGSGVVVACDSLRTGVLLPGEWVSHSEDKVLSLSRRQWRTAGFDWIQGEHIRPLSALRWRLRLYIPGLGTRSRDVLGSCGDALSHRGIWFQAKARRTSTEAADAVVIWVAAKDAVQAVNILHALDLPRINEPPPACLRRHGIGLSADPTRGMSFGWTVCSAVWDSVSMNAHAGRGPLDWVTVAARAGLNAKFPHRHPHVDPYGIWTALECD